MNHKIKCRKCKKSKALTEFNKDKKTKLGVRTICRVCSRKYDKSIASSPGRRFSKYKESAKVRNIKFNLERKQFIKLTSQPCHYCGKFSQLTYAVSKKDYCGLDRLNSNKGYSADNVVPCCHMCNMMKGTLSYKEFVSAIKNISENLSKKENSK